MKDWRAELEAQAIPDGSIENIRSRILTKARITPGIITKVFKTLEDALDANETKFFSYMGKVTDQRDVPDYGARLSAADKFLTVSGMYPRGVESGKSLPNVAMEVDPKTGVVRIVVGHNIGREVPNVVEGVIPQSSLALPVDENQLDLFNTPGEIARGEQDTKEEPFDEFEHVKFVSKSPTVPVASRKDTKLAIEDVKIPDYIWKVLNG